MEATANSMGRAVYGKAAPEDVMDPDAERGVREMTRPSFRFFIIPLGAICTLASLSAQNTTPRAQRDRGSMVVHEQVVDCSSKSPSEVCVIR
jgi:hypothetical protein